MLRDRDLLRPSKKGLTKKKLIGGVVLGLLLGLGLRFLIHSYLLFPFKVSNTAMEPGIPQGEYVYISRWFQPKKLKRGALVFLSHPNTPKYKFILRIVAMPGEQVAIREGRIYVNGRVLEDPWEKRIQQHLKTLPIIKTVFSQRDFLEPRTLKEGEIFALADDRKNAIDSRLLGAFSLQQVEGIINQK